MAAASTACGSASEMLRGYMFLSFDEPERGELAENETALPNAKSKANALHSRTFERLAFRCISPNFAFAAALDFCQQ
jgi:hypothetical protein